jgi:endonuclease YncB( thermonuclease family)
LSKYSNNLCKSLRSNPKLERLRPHSRDRSVGGADLGEWLVRNGLALDWPQYSKGKYASAQREADRSGRGMWAGSYVEPWLFRGCIRAGGTPANCSDDANAHP